MNEIGTLKSDRSGKNNEPQASHRHRPVGARVKRPRRKIESDV